MSAKLSDRYRDAAKLRAKRERWNQTKRIRRAMGERDLSRASQMNTINLIRFLIGYDPIAPACTRGPRQKRVDP